MSKMDDREVGIVDENELVLGGEIAVEKIPSTQPSAQPDDEVEEFVTPRER